MPQAYAATSSYSCVSGGTLYGSTCLRTTVYAATPAYNCPSGGRPSGSTCTQTSSYAATPVYSCNNGAALNGSTCTQTNTSAATAAYRCPHGGTLSGSQCTGAYTIKTAYIYLNGKQIAETVIDGATRFVHTDALGSPVAHTNAAGAELNRTKYEPYGYTAAGTKPGVAAAGLATTGSAIGFTGHVNDPETDLVYMQQRYYDPVAGRFLSIDPVTTDANTGGSFNRYAYAANNPYKYIDPDGRQERAAEAFGDQFRNDVAAGNASVYEPFQGPAIAVGIGMLIGPPVAAAIMAPAEATVVAGAAGKSAVQALKLEKSLASEAQTARLAAGKGEVIAGAGTKTPYRDAGRLAEQHGGKAVDWQKVSGGNHVAKDGTKIETHAAQNRETKQVVELKTKLRDEGQP